MSYFILIPLSIMFLEQDMMEMACDSSDPFGGLSTQYERVNSSSLTHTGLNVLGGHIQIFILQPTLWKICSDFLLPNPSA